MREENMSCELLEGGVLFIRLQVDEIAGQVASGLLEEVEEWVERDGVRHCFVEMTKVRYIDSSGLGVIAELLREVSQRQGSVVLIHCDKGLSEIIEVMGFYRKVLQADSIENARLLLANKD